MSQENVGLIRSMYEAFNDRDLDALMANFTEDVEWRLIGGFADLMGTDFRGRDGVRRFYDDWIDNLGGRGEVERVLEVGDRVAVIATVRTAGRASGAPAELRFGQLFSFRDGLISAVDLYYEASEVLEAVGLRE
jgi:ketosteroid isomerase-like protein